MDHQNWGSIIIGAGLLLIAGGLLICFTGWKWIRWFGHLPGDIRIEKENVRIYFPIVSMLLLSLIVSLILRLFRS